MPRLPRTVMRYSQAKATWRRVRARWQTLRAALLIGAGILCAGFGLAGFLMPNGFIDGGVTGVSLLLQRLTGWPLPALLLLLNLPFMALGWRQIGRGFALKSVGAICGLALAVALVPYPPVTSDKLLVAVFGGFFLGAGIGLAMRGGGVLDGTEVLAVYMGRRAGLSVGDVLLLLNIGIFGVAATTLGLETALYSVLTYLSASKTVDFLIEGLEEYLGVTIISTHSDEVRQMLLNKMGRGVTIYQGRRGLSQREIDIVFTVITRLELARLRSELEQLDPHAFIVIGAVKDTRGGVLRRRALQH